MNIETLDSHIYIVISDQKNTTSYRDDIKYNNEKKYDNDDDNYTQPPPYDYIQRSQITKTVLIENLLDLSVILCTLIFFTCFRKYAWHSIFAFGGIEAIHSFMKLYQGEEEVISIRDVKYLCRLILYISIMRVSYHIINLE